jgi:very-short-patch-repair endonuclease
MKSISIRGVLLKENPLHGLPYNAKLKQRAFKLRKAGNFPEVLFWMQVTKGKFHNMDFDRQRVIGNFIVDFYIKQLGLVIEIDGESHDEKVEYDLVRETYLKSLGLRVYRIYVIDIMQRLPVVMAALEEYMVSVYGIKE